MENIIISKHGDLYTIRLGNSSSDNMCWEEMVGLLISLTIPNKKPCLQWMKTDEQRERDFNEIPNFTNEETGEIGKMIRPKY